MMGKNIVLSLLATTICLLVFFSLIPEKDSPPPSNPFLQKALQQYRDSVAWSLKRYGPPGVAIAIVKDSSIILLEGLGNRSVKQGDTVNEHTVFRIGSLSKGFATVLWNGVQSWAGVGSLYHLMKAAPLLPVYRKVQ